MSKFIKKESNPCSPTMQKFASWNGIKAGKTFARTNNGQGSHNQTIPRKFIKNEEGGIECQQTGIATHKKSQKILTHHRQGTNKEDRPTIPRHGSQNDVRVHYNSINSSVGEYEIEERFQQIEHLFNEENENLKHQKQYLLQVIEKMQKKEKEYKNQLKKYKELNNQLHFENTILRKKYEQAREFISKGIGMIQESVTKNISNQGFNIANQTINNLNQSMKSSPYCLSSANYAAVNVTQTTNSGNQSLNNSRSAQDILSKNSLGTISQTPLSPHADTTTSLNVSQTIEELSDKFDAMMFQYQKTRNPEIRKKCMEIAKDIKKIKKNNGLSYIARRQQ